MAESLVAAFGMSEAAADAIANAVVDPSAVREGIGDPKILRGSRRSPSLAACSSAFGRGVVPTHHARPRKPRSGRRGGIRSRSIPGAGCEGFLTLPAGSEPRSPEGKPPTVPELVVDIDSRHHLEWASAQAANYVLAENDWRDSIRSQGVMEAVWLVATTYLHADSSAPVTVLTSAEGSSRATAVHNILGTLSSDVPYEDPDPSCGRTTAS